MKTTFIARPLSFMANHSTPIIGLVIALITIARMIAAPPVGMSSQTIAAGAVVRHAPEIKGRGRVEGSLRQLLADEDVSLVGEDVTLDGGVVIAGDLLLPGSPNVVINGNPIFGGVVEGTGSTQPSGYTVKLSGNVQLGHLVTRTNPVPLAAVPAPPTATGTRDVVISSPGQSPGDFASLRDLTLSGSVGDAAVPPGTYRQFNAGGQNGFIFGVAGASQPSVYNLDALALSGGSTLRVVGPIRLTVAKGVTVSNGSTAGSINNPLWLSLNVAGSEPYTVTVNGGSAIHGVIRAPSTKVKIDGGSRVTGSVFCDRLSINGSSLLQGVADTTPPVLSIDQPPDDLLTNLAQVAVAGSFSDQTETIITVNGITASYGSNGFTASVGLNEGTNILRVVAADIFGNQTEAIRTIVRDTVPPAITVQEPSNGAVIADQRVTASGTFSDASATSVTVNGLSAVIDGNAFTASAPLSEGLNRLRIVASDAAGNSSEVIRTVIRVAPLTLSVFSPPDQTIVGIARVPVSGSVAGTGALVTVNGTSLPIEGGFFNGELTLPEGENQIRIVATDASGARVETIRTVTVDLSTPVLSELSPAQNSLISTATATVQGRVTDVTLTRVKVNEISAAIDSNGLFTAAGVPISDGENLITVNAVDAVGNVASRQLILIGKDRTAPTAPTVFPVISPTRLSFQSIEGRAEPCAQVRITGGTEPITVQAAAGTGLFVASVNLAGGVNTLSITVADAAGNVSSSIMASITSDPSLPMPPAGQAAQMNTATGNGQRGLVATELPRPLLVILTDRSGNPVPGVTVRFTVTHGGGHLIGGGGALEAMTNGQGYASARYVTGSSPGIQLVRADFAGNLSTPVIFTSEAIEPFEGGSATVSGVVLDQNTRALPNVLVRIGGQQTRSAADGRFVIANVPAGPHQLLELIGRDQVSLPGRWPNISYEVDVLPGVDNSLGRPLFLPKVNEGVALPLDSNNIATRDVSYELPVVADQPPIKVTVRAGTRVTFPPDASDRRFSVTRISTNRVPMALEDGRATNLYISVQPSGAIFDPPLDISFPNLDHLPAATDLLLMSFDHDAGRYVRVGTGRVSDDGRFVNNRPGSGIRIGAWHAFPPSPPCPETTIVGHIQVEGNPELEDKLVTDAEAWVEGVRAVLMNEPGVIGALARLDYRAILSLPCNNSFRATKMEATVKAIQGKIDAEYINQDRPFNSDIVPLPSGVPVYGGSSDETGDYLNVIASVQEEAVRKYTWSVTGPGASAYSPPTPSDAAKRWHLGHLKARAGILKFQAVMELFSGRRIRVVRNIEVGIRTDSITAIGYIDPDNVPLSTVGMDSGMLAFYPPAGAANMSSAQKNLTAIHLGTLASAGALGSGRTFHPVLARELRTDEKVYLLNWMFKFAANYCSKNRCPPASFSHYDEISQFETTRKTSYKLFSRFQIKYLTDGTNIKPSTIIQLIREAQVGVTNDPVFDSEEDGEAGPNNRIFGVSNGANVFWINDGTPTSVAVNAFNALAFPLRWSHIGSRIQFSASSATNAAVFTQVYPTYFIFNNLTRTGVITQAPNPIGNFSANPYPPGPAPFVP